MRRLILFRHAKAVPTDGSIRDYDRPLDTRGRKDAPKMGAYLARHRLVPDLAIVSPAKRTRETWELAAAAFPVPPPVIYEDRLYDASPQIILDVIKIAGGNARNLIVVGHNPGIHQLAVLLLAAGDVNLREQLREQLPTSGLVTIEFAFEDWKKLHPQAGRLDRYVTPKTLDIALD